MSGLLLFAGCRSSQDSSFDASYAHYRSVVQQVEYPDVQVGAQVLASETATLPPPTVRRFDQIEYLDLTLEDAVRMAIDNNETVRQVGGAIVRAPANASTIYDSAIQETDPRFGVDAALSAFDAQFNSAFSTGHRERQINLVDPSLRYRIENVGQFSFGLGKVAATGTEFRLDQTTASLNSNLPFNRVPGAFDTQVSATVRHPLMQGGGVEFNRIAGPGSVPGVYRGVLIARVNNDIALVDFQTAVRNLLRDVERGYWELYFAYRDLDAKIEGRRYALESWELEKRRVDAKLRSPDQEAYAREQYYAAQASVENAISGERGVGGIFGAERELRSLLGLTATDGKLLRPTTLPLSSDIQFDWEESLHHALNRREELRRQRWRVKQRELELVASRNFTLPRMNAIGQYNWRGFGDDLIGQDDASIDNLFTGELQGWGLGVELTSPIGRRAGFAAVRNAELWLRREHAILLEQERQIALELRGAFSELDRAYVVTRSSFNRHVAAQIQLEAERRRNAVGDARLDLVLDAQRRSVQAEVAFHRAIVDYNQALAQVNLARGTLFDSLDVHLAEGPWSAESHDSAAARSQRFVPKRHGDVPTLPEPFSMGEFPEQVEPATRPAPEPIPQVEALPPDPMS